MQRTSLVTLSLGTLATFGFLVLGSAREAVVIWIGALWGLANLWCLRQAVNCWVKAQGGWRLTGWLCLKFLGLYGLVVWFFLGLKVPALAWLIGFTFSLIGLMLSTFPSLGSLFLKGYRWLLPLSFFLFGTGALAAEEAGGQAVHPPEIPNLITLITYGRHGPVVDFLHTWENAIFAFLIAGLVGGTVALGTKALALLPGRGQVALEAIVEGMDNLVCGVLGKKEGRRYLPFLGTLFLYILSMNLAGLVPGLKSPTSRFEMTGALALCVFAFVQWTGIRRLGMIRYMDHMLGEPRNWFGWVFMAPLLLFIHVIGELVKPLSLSLRLFGNIMGEDTLLGVFVVLGALCMAWSHLPIGIPFHLPFVFLAIIFSVVQALVFTSLSMIYIYMMLPHEEHS